MYTGQFNQDEFIHKRYFQTKRSGVSIECGAFDGLTESGAYFFEREMGWTSINIEAYPLIYDRLCQNRPNSINISIALSNNVGVTTFKHAVHPRLGENFGNGSISHKEEHIQDLIGQNCTFTDHKVKVDTYKNVLNEVMTLPNMRGKSIDLLILDVEGNELNVIEGMDGSEYLPKVLCIEYPHVGLDNIKNSLTLLSLEYDLDCTFMNNAYFLLKS